MVKRIMGLILTGTMVRRILILRRQRRATAIAASAVVVKMRVTVRAM